MSEERDREREPAEAPRQTVDEAQQRSDDRRRGISNHSRDAKQQEREKLPPRGERKVE